MAEQVNGVYADVSRDGDQFVVMLASGVEHRFDSDGEAISWAREQNIRLLWGHET